MSDLIEFWVAKDIATFLTMLSGFAIVGVLYLIFLLVCHLIKKFSK